MNFVFRKKKREASEACKRNEYKLNQGIEREKRWAVLWLHKKAFNLVKISPTYK